MAVKDKLIINFFCFKLLITNLKQNNFICYNN